MDSPAPSPTPATAPAPASAPRNRRARRAAAGALAALALFAGAWAVPHRWCMREAGRWYQGDPELQGRLARGVERWLEADLRREQFHTATQQFSGEWFYGTYMMAAVGLTQAAIEHPEWRERHSALVDRCLDRLVSEEVRSFDTASWRGDDALAGLERGGGHAAYLGYMNLALGLRRLLGAGSRHAELNDRVTAALVRRVGESPTLLVETYPGEAYPVDNCAVIASIAVNGRAAGRDCSALLAAWERACREKYRDPATGLLRQAVDAQGGTPEDEPRGSGTTLGLYFLSFSHPGLSAELYAAVRRELADTFLGFGAVREYPRGRSGHGDIDSGPLVLGYGISPTGFSLAGARLHGDREYFARLYASAYFAGAPFDRNGERHFVTGGPLGDAILLAMLTANRGASVPGPREGRR